MTDTDPDAATAGGHLVEAAKEGGKAVTQAAEGAAELGRLYAGLLEEQLRHNRQVAAALGRAVGVDWDEAVRAQGEFVRASLERLARLNDRHLEVVRAAMAVASAAAAGTRPGGPPQRRHPRA